jgi:TolA-binding protein
MRHITFALAAVLTLAAPAVRAQQDIQSQEGITLQNEIEQLQSQVQQLQANPGGGGGSALGSGGGYGGGGYNGGGQSSAPPQSGDIVATLLTQVQQLQSQVRDLNGKVDALQNQVTTQNAQTEKEIGDLKFQMSNGGQPGAQAPQPGSAQAPQPGSAQGAQAGGQAMAPVAAAGSPRDQLHAALVAYDRHDYGSAAQMAQALVTNNKRAPEAYRAQFLVGQAYSAKGDDQDAAIAYDATYNMNRAGTYAASSLLGLAGSLANISQNEAACDTLASFNSQFTSPSASEKVRAGQIAHKARCH